MKGQLSEIISPAGLREAILAGARVSQTKVHPWRQPARIAMGLAAAIVLVGVAFTWSKRLATNDHRLVELALQTQWHGMVDMAKNSRRHKRS